LDLLPAAIYTADRAARITYFNAAAAAPWGCRPELGRAEFRGTWKLLGPMARRWRTINVRWHRAQYRPSLPARCLPLAKLRAHKREALIAAKDAAGSKRDRLSDDLRGRVAEQPLRPAIPACDDAIEVFADDSVVDASTIALNSREACSAQARACSAF
jgi:hypothetical protein